MNSWLELWPIIDVSLRVAVAAVTISAAIGVPLGLWLGLKRFIGRRLLIT